MGMEPDLHEGRPPVRGFHGDGKVEFLPQQIRGVIFMP